MRALRPTSRRKLAAYALVALAGCGLLSLLRSHFFHLGPQHSPAIPPTGVLFINHGGDHVSPMLSCIADQLAQRWETVCSHGVALVTSVNQSANPFANMASFGYMVDLARAAIEEQTGWSKPPYLITRASGADLQETCYDSAAMARDALIVRHISTHSSSPGRVCKSGCPCHDGVTSCLEFGSCFVSLPMSDGLLWVHVVVNPVDSVLWKFQSLTRQTPVVESWVHKPNYVGNLGKDLAEKGIRKEFLVALGLMDPHNAKLSYGQMLKKLSDDDGVFLEFLRSLPDLWKSARVYRRLSLKPSHKQQYRELVLHAPDLVPEVLSSVIDFIRSLDPMLKGLGSSCLSTLGGKDAAMRMALKCSIEESVGSGGTRRPPKEQAEEKRRRVAALLKHPYAADQILRLEGAMGVGKYAT